MAISKQLRDEADRTIAGITSYYEQYGDVLIDAEEREHRISKVTAALEGCNGLTEKEKLQKTAENLFGLTCAWERDSLALKRELVVNREAIEQAFKKAQTETSDEFTKLGGNMDALERKLDKISAEMHKFLSSGLVSPGSGGMLLPSPQSNVKLDHSPWYYKTIAMIDRHFGTFVFFAISFLLLLILSGNLEWVSQFFKPAV